MTITLIITIGILIIAGLAFWSSKTENVIVEFKPIRELTPTDFEKDFEKMGFNGGTLRFWGNWFGKPMDNQHEIKNVEFDKEINLLTLTLSEGEKLKIWNPSDIEIGKKELRIRKAKRILFEWYLYGQSANDENLRFENYINSGLNISFKTDFIPEKRNVECHKSEPALSIIGY
jgi:hypothetical protein